MELSSYGSTFSPSFELQMYVWITVWNSSCSLMSSMYFRFLRSIRSLKRSFISTHSRREASSGPCLRQSNLLIIVNIIAK